MTKTLAKTYSVQESEVLVEVQESRRLAGPSSGVRRLAGNFAVSFTVKVHPENAAAADAATEALKKDPSAMHTDMKAELKSLGVSDETLNAMEVKELSVTVTRPPKGDGATNTTAAPTNGTTGAPQAVGEQLTDAASSGFGSTSMTRLASNI